MAEGLDIGTLTGRIELEDRLTNILGQIGGSLGKFEEGWKDAGRSVLENAASFFTAEAALHVLEGALHGGIELLKELTIEGAVVSDVADNFDHLTESAGRSAETLLGALHEGTHNTVSDLELMKLANADLSAGLNLTDAQFKLVADGAFALAQATGKSVPEALQTMNTALLTGRTISLQQLTGVVDLTNAADKYAKTLGTTADKLTEQEKLQAKQAAMLEAIGNSVQRLGAQTDGLDEILAQGQVAWANFREELGANIATSPVLMAGLEGIRDELAAAFGGNQEQLIKNITDAINNALISVVDFAKIVVDGIGFAAKEWDAFKVVVATSEQGFRAITYVVEEVLLGLMKVANFVSGGSLFGDAIAATEKDLDRLYNAMAQGENKIAGYKKAEDEWADTTEKMRGALDRVQERMKKAQEETKSATETTDAATESDKHNADAIARLTKEHEKHAPAVRQSKEEIKAMDDAMAELNSVGKNWHETLLQIDGEVVEAVKYYLDAGVSLDKLAVAYGLTKTQAEAIQNAWKAGNEQIKAQGQALDFLTGLWDKYYDDVAALGATDTGRIKLKAEQDYEIQVKKLQELGDDNEDHYNQLWDLMQKNIEKEEQNFLLSDQNSRASLEAKLRNAQAYYDFMNAHSDQYTQKDIANQNQIVAHLQDMLLHWGAITNEVEKQTEKVTGLTKSVAELNQNLSFSTDVTSANFDEMAMLFHLNPTAAGKLAKLGYSFAEIVQYLSNPSSGPLPPPKGPRIPGFREGGVADFGEGTIAMLHGKEAVIPLDRAEGLGSITNHFYVNGTADDVARKISEVIMRQLKSQRQFGAA